MVPTWLGKYEVIEEIARGAYGIVLRARDSEIGREVAIKILRDEEDDEAVIERFLREARLAARLSHPNIVRVFESGDRNGLPFFVMELVEGLPLTAVIYTSKGEARPTAVLFEKIARAVHFAHERGVIHRDLKPGNIVLRDGDDPVVMDFGIAHDERRRTALTRAGELLGTPQYMAPEQISGRAVDARSDVYAIGAMLFEMLTRRAPFDACGFAELSMMILNDEPASPFLLNPFIDRELERICLKCLRKKPDERYATAKELADDLGRVARATTVVPKPAPRPPRRVAWLGLVGALLSGLLAAATPSKTRPGKLVESEPSGASVYVDGKFAGRTPVFVDAEWVRVLELGREAHARPGFVLLPDPAPDGMVAIGGLYVDATEVTNGRYAEFVDRTGARAPWKSLPKSRVDEPVTGVTWEEAAAFAAWAGKRLPTIAEWSEAARCPALSMTGGVQEWAADVHGDFRALCGGSDGMAERGPDTVLWRSNTSRLPDAGFRCVRPQKRHK